MTPEQLIEELRYIQIYTQNPVRDHWAGDYRSPLRGRGFEFDQHKIYQHGDDYRQIDWNVTARMRHPYVKRAFEEKELGAMIVADLSRSMDFASAEQSKRELLVKVAATLAFAAASDNMKVGLLGFTDGIEVELPLKKGLKQVWKILDSLWHIQPVSRATRFARALEYLATHLKRSTLIFCISDFITPEDLFASDKLKHLARRHDFIPIIIRDGWEEALPQGKGYMRLRDAEWGGEMLLALSGRQRRRYETLMRERKDTLQRWLYRLQLDHLSLRPGEPFLDLLIGFFLTRKGNR
ncbi:MAG: DUF58 domain-containing protein [Deltaproteobacteria bacterium]|nr:DUF58 domain-containing protein [Deltaproteobacteria bacterium]